MRRGTALAMSVLVCATATGCGSDDDGVEVDAGTGVSCVPLRPGQPLTLGAGGLEVPSGSRVRIYPVQLEGQLSLRDVQTVLVPETVGADGTHNGLGATYDEVSALEGATVVPSEGHEIRGPVTGLQVGVVLHTTGPTHITGAPVRYSVLDGPVDIARGEGTDITLAHPCR